MCVYLDGLAVDKPIDIFESFGMGRPTGGVEMMVLWRLRGIWTVGEWDPRLVFKSDTDTVKLIRS